MKIILAAITMLILACTFPASKKTTIWLAGDSTMSIKDVKAYPETGWGMPFTHFWDSTIQVVNLAKNGRSTKTFLSEGLWQKIYDGAQKGDYVFIQFGHNDESSTKKERYSSPDSFKINLTNFVRQVIEKEAHPILITPVSRRKFDYSGTAMETHKLYSQLVIDVANATKTPFIDLDLLSRNLYQSLGDVNSKLLFLQLKPGEHPNYPDGKEDNTHFNELGARLIAQLVLKEIRVKVPSLAGNIISKKTK